MALQRSTTGLLPIHQQIIEERYAQILPILEQLLSVHDIRERNRTWAGVSPEGKGATSLLLTKHAGTLRRTIKAHTTDKTEQAKLWTLIRAYCQFGPIGLIDALPSDCPPLIPDELASFARFHRLGKHPRTDAGIYIRGLLDRYADALGSARLPSFVARYAFVTNRKLKRWFVAEDETTLHVTKTHRRLNLDMPYPNKQWRVHVVQCPFRCHLSRYTEHTVQPWLIWLDDSLTHAVLGVRLVPNEPSLADMLATLRWSIWHYDAAWWASRGIPDELWVPCACDTLTEYQQHALDYLHTTVVEQAQGDHTVPAVVEHWLTERQAIRANGAELPTLATELRYVWESFRDAQAGTLTTTTPETLQEHAVSLPWHDGVAAAYLLPSAGHQTMQNGQIHVYGVPYDAANAGVADGTSGEVFYDLDDARQVYLVHSGAHVAVAPAVAFTGGRVAWWDVALDPLALLD